MFRFASRAAKQRAVAAAGAAFTIRESSVYDTPRELQIAPNQRVEKQFRFNADDAAATKKIDVLVLATPGYTRVVYNEIGRENVVRVSSDSEAHLDAIEVVAHGANGLEVRTKKHHHMSGGHLLTEIFLAQPTEVTDLKSEGSGVTVIDENILVANRPKAALAIKHSGCGKLFVTNTANTIVHSLDVSLSGSGDIHLMAPSMTIVERATLAGSSSGNLRMFATTLDANKVSLGMAGSGDVQLATQALTARAKIGAAVAGSGTVRVFSASIVAPKIKLAVAGSGDVRIGAQEQLATQTLKSAIAGSGDIVIAARTAQCGEHDIAIAGSGDVDAGDLAVQHAKVAVLGSGDAIIQVTDTLKYSKMGSGSVKYVGAAPASVVGSGRSKDKELTHLVRYDAHSVLDKIASGWKAPTAIPVREEAFSSIAVHDGSGSGSTYVFHAEIRSWRDLVAKTQELLGFRSATSPAAAAAAPSQPLPFAGPPVSVAKTDAALPYGEVDLRAAPTAKQLDQPSVDVETKRAP